MALFVSKLKLKAAARSMHQFCPVVRSIFPDPPTDDVVEASTMFLYTHVAMQIFGKRFTERLQRELEGGFKFSTPVDVEARIFRIGRNLQEYERVAAMAAPVRSPQEQFTDHVHGVIGALLAEGGFGTHEPELVRLTFPRFERAVRRVKDHLLGINQQSSFIMK